MRLKMKSSPRLTCPSNRGKWFAGEEPRKPRKQALPPFNTLFMDNRTGRRGRWRRVCGGSWVVCAVLSMMSFVYYSWLLNILYLDVHGSLSASAQCPLGESRRDPAQFSSLSVLISERWTMNWLDNRRTSEINPNPNPKCVNILYLLCICSAYFCR